MSGLVHAVAEAGSAGGRETASSAGEADCDGIAQAEEQMRLCVVSEHPSPGSPSPCSDGIGLLSLPWEMVTRIAWHLPAQCIINVLPQVCRVLGEVGEDSAQWQKRAQRLVGAGASFPVGSRGDLDWPSACLEMEQLLSLWSHMEERGGEGEGGVGEGGGGGREEEAPAAEERRGGEGVEQRGRDEEVQRRGEQEREGEERHGEGEEVQRAGDQEEQRGRGEEEEVLCEDLPPSLERFSLPAGHIGDVHSVLLFGGQGSLCATGSRDRNVNLWDLRGDPGAGPGVGQSQGRLIRTLGEGGGGESAHTGWVWCLAQRDGLLASGAFDSTVRLWDLGAGGAPRGRITGRAPVICLSWQPDVLLAGSHDKKISVYDHRAPQPLVKRVQVHSSAVLSLVANERYIISGGKDNTVALYDRRAAKLLNRLTLDSFLLSMSSSGPEVWAGDNQGSIHTFSQQSGMLRQLGHFSVGHTHLVTGIHYSPGSLYTCSSDCTIRLSVEAGVLAVASGNMAVEVWRPPPQ